MIKTKFWAHQHIVSHEYQTRFAYLKKVAIRKESLFVDERKDRRKKRQ